METQSMLVVPVGEEQEFNIYISSQWPTLVQVRKKEAKFIDRCQGLGAGEPRLNALLSKKQEVVAETLDIPSNRVICHVKRMGGAFGGKVTKTSILAGITSLAAWK